MSQGKIPWKDPVERYTMAFKTDCAHPILRNPEFLFCLIFSRQLWCNQITILLGNWLYEGQSNLWDWRTMSSHLYLQYNCMYSGIPVDDYSYTTEQLKAKIFKNIFYYFTYICPKFSTSYIPPTLVVVVYSIVADKKILDCRLSVRKNNTDQSYASFHCGKNSKYSSKVIGLVHSHVFIPILS